MDGVAAVVDVLADEVDAAGNSDEDGVGAIAEGIVQRAEEGGGAVLVAVGGQRREEGRGRHGVVVEL